MVVIKTLLFVCTKKMDLNKVMLIWRITTDLELKKLWQSDTSVMNFSLATNRRYKNKEGNSVEESEFHRCVIFWPQADVLNQFMHKGSKIYVEGRLRTRKWEDTNGNIRYSTEVVIENFIFLDPKSQSNNGWVAPSSNPISSSVQSMPKDMDDEELPF